MWFAELYIHDNTHVGRPVKSVASSESQADVQDWVRQVIKWVAAGNYSDSAYVKNITITNVRPS